MSSRRHHTEWREDNEHLCIELPEIFPNLPPPKPKPDSLYNDDACLATNFGIQVYDPYCFILLHLRNKSNKSPLNINIPEVCIFSERSPYDLVSSREGFIRGAKHSEGARLRLRDVNKLFRESTPDSSKSEHSVACFSYKQVLMMSDNDLFLVCCKIKTDPFFNKLLYLRNKMPANNNRHLNCAYNASEDNRRVLKLATESMLMLRNEQEIEQQLLAGSEEDGEQEYLRFMNMKIVLYLNYEHNIRVSECMFIYVKSNEGKYYLVNATRLKFNNLTQAIRDREKKLARMEEKKAEILLMTPDKEQKYKQYEASSNVKTLQKLMTGHFGSILKEMSFSSISDNKREQVKNEIAFKKMHPRCRYTYTEVISSPQFGRVKDEVLNIEQRKRLTMPSRYVMRYYNQVKGRTRAKTEAITEANF